MRSNEAAISQRLLAGLNALPGVRFRKLSDKFQIGIADTIGSYKGLYVAIEMKFADVLDPSVELPKKHPFGGAQITDLMRTEETGGVGLCAIGCTSTILFFHPEAVNTEGRVMLAETNYITAHVGDLANLINYLDRRRAAWISQT